MLFERHSITLLVIYACSILTSYSFADDAHHFSSPFQKPVYTPSQGDLGGIGLLQMPTARMTEEGVFSAGYNNNSEYEFYTVSLQLMPWLETTMRYTQVRDVLYSNNETFSGKTKYTDKGIDTKLRLLEESRWRPEISVGLRDIGGTGLFDGEFIAATKRFTSNEYGTLDFTLGLGWGYLGERANINSPLCDIALRYCERLPNSGGTGTIDYKRWFTGKTALFGGVEYQTLYSPLRLKIEYDGNNYSQDFPVTRGGVDMTPKTPWNFGAVYAINDSFDVRLSYERGTTLALGFTLSTNFSEISSPSLDTPIPPLGTQQAESLENVNWNQIDNELEEIAGYKTDSIHQEGNTISIIAQQNKYRNREVAAERAAAVLANHLPTEIQSYKIVEQEKNLPLKSTEISAQGYKAIANVEYFNPSIKDAIKDIPPTNITSTQIYENVEPLSYGFAPRLSQSVGTPESFYVYSLGLEGDVSYWLSPNLEISSSITINIVDNLDKLNFIIPPDGTSNYRVRTLVRAYVDNNDAYMSNLQLTWFNKYGKSWYQQVYGGYLETMFAGVGTEVLYREPNSNWAIGADINAISQRNPNSFFDTFTNDDGYDKSTKVLANGTTGHLSLYYQPEWSFLENTLFRLDVGKFLATDVGARLDFSKQYKSGVIVGAYASKTDMSAEDFGEGSFTKGFYLSIPFDAIYLKPTNTRARFQWLPLDRDGGRVLEKRNSLFELTDVVSPWYQRPRQN